MAGASHHGRTAERLGDATAPSRRRRVLAPQEGQLCDYCGEALESTQELNLLCCTYCGDDDNCYHQDCLERYLKSIRCERRGAASARVRAGLRAGCQQ